MGYRILENHPLSDKVFRMKIEAPLVAKKHRAGQFVVVRVNETGERIPLTVVEKDSAQGWITLMVQKVGKSTSLLGAQPAGSSLLDVVGPLGTPTHVEKFGTAVCLGGGIGLAALYPIAEALKNAGNNIVSVIGAQTASLLVLEKEMASLSDRITITTDDGSRGEKGFVTGPFKNILDSGEKVDLVVAVGPLPMMKAVAEMTRAPGIKTIVSLNTIMIDGTGMCGGCRVGVSGQSQFTCVDGPEFDAHQVDFDNLSKRLRAYCEQEACALDRFLKK